MPSFHAGLQPAHPTLTDLRNTPDDEFDDGPSKSARKRAMHALQALGERIVALDAQRTAQLELPERLVDAVELCRRIRDHEGRRRQMQFIGKLMRDVDADRVAAQIDAFGAGHRQEVALQHAAEAWRDRLLKDPSQLTGFTHAHPNADVQRLRQLLRQAQRTPDQPRPRRELYRELLHTLQPDAPSQDPDTHDDDA